MQYWLGLAPKKRFGHFEQLHVVCYSVELKSGEKGGEVEDHDARKKKNQERSFVLVALTDLLDRWTGADKAGGQGGVGEATDGRIGHRRFGPFRLTPVNRVGKTKNKSSSEI